MEGPNEPDDEFDDAEDDGLPVPIDCDGCGRVMEPGLFDGDDLPLTVLPDSSGA
ncbi:hypothetical protein [Streptomyces sp. HUAS TT7]|uniref:hypothetical protein n=1 Tax=Streptomyces sp. HUAS TT7 TaxID=3447507 RepID=UPI003F65684E